MERSLTPEELQEAVDNMEHGTSGDPGPGISNFKEEVTTDALADLIATKVVEKLTGGTVE